MFPRLAAALLALIVWAAPAAAEEIEGADDPVFRAAVERWLGGDDARSLPILAELAKRDHLAAQMFLGAVERRNLGWTRYTAGLSREDYRAIFRKMDTRFGTGWLTVAAERSPLAALLAAQPAALPDGGYGADPLLELAARGEPRAGFEGLFALLNQGHWEEVLRLEEVAAALGLEGMLPAAASYADREQDALMIGDAIASLVREEMQGYLFMQLANDKHPGLGVFMGRSDLANEIIVPPFPFKSGEDLSPEAAVFLDGWLEAAAEAAPVRRYCARHCGAEEGACRRQVYRLLGAYSTLPFATSSPLESIVPQEVYAESERALIALAYFALSVPHANVDPHEGFANLEIASCLRDGLAPQVIGR